jgi:hypothetical protein
VSEPTERTLFASILEQCRIVKEATTRWQPRRRRERTPLEGDPRTLEEEPAKNSNKESEELKPYPVEIWEDE